MAGENQDAGTNTGAVGAGNGAEAGGTNTGADSGANDQGVGQNGAENGTGEAGAAESSVGKPAGEAEKGQGSLLGDALKEKDEEKKPDEKSAEDKDEKGEEDKDKDKEDGVPEEYKFEVNENTNIDKGALEAFKPLAKELELTQDKAQKLVDFMTEHSDRVTNEMKAKEAEAVANFKKETQADPNYTENIRNAKLAINEFAKDAPAFTKLADGWLGDHPAFVKVFANIGQRLREAGMDKSGPGSKDVKDLTFAEAVYGKK